MRSLLAHSLLWLFGVFAVLNLCGMAVLLFRVARDAYWRWRFRRAITRKYPSETQPLIHLIRKSMEER